MREVRAIFVAVTMISIYLPTVSLLIAHEPSPAADLLGRLDAKAVTENGNHYVHRGRGANVILLRKLCDGYAKMKRRYWFHDTSVMSGMPMYLLCIPHGPLPLWWHCRKRLLPDWCGPWLEGVYFWAHWGPTVAPSTPHGAGPASSSIPSPLATDEPVRKKDQMLYGNICLDSRTKKVCFAQACFPAFTMALGRPIIFSFVNIFPWRDLHSRTSTPLPCCIQMERKVMYSTRSLSFYSVRRRKLSILDVENHSEIRVAGYRQRNHSKCVLRPLERWYSKIWNSIIFLVRYRASIYLI